MRGRVIPPWMDVCFPDDRPMNAKRAIACKECTDGWIKDLEHRSRPLVSGMIAGLPVILAQQNQEMLARWVAKTVLSMQADRDPELLPLAAYQQLTQTGRPPDGLRVSVALRPHEGKWPYRFASMGSASTLRDWDVLPTFPGTILDHYYAELCLGHLVIRVGAQWTPHGMRLPVGPAAIQVWPLSTPVRWPPKRGIVRLVDERIPEGPIVDEPDGDQPGVPEPVVSEPVVGEPNGPGPGRPRAGRRRAGRERPRGWRAGCRRAGPRRA